MFDKAIPDTIVDTLTVLDSLGISAWIVNLPALEIVYTNLSVIDNLGYSRGEIAQRPITELIHPELQERCRQTMLDFAGSNDNQQHWTLVDSAGQSRHVRTRLAQLTLNGETCLLVSHEFDVIDATARQAVDDFRSIFEQAPGKLLILAPFSHKIVAVSNEYLDATMTSRQAILGRSIFDIFPDNPDDPAADGEQNLKASLERVERLKTTDVMGIQRYPVRDGDGIFEERFWSPVNLPIKDGNGDIKYIAHRVEDLTPLIKEAHRSELTTAPQSPLTPLVEDVLLQVDRMKNTLGKVEEQDARLRTVERLLHAGWWEYDIASSALIWPDFVHELYGSASGSSQPDFAQYLAMVHPDDKADMLALYQTFIDAEEPQLLFQHRIVRPDGNVVHVRAVGERYEKFGRQVVVGFVQDVSELMNVKLQAEKDRLNLSETLENISDAFIILDKAWNFRFLNHQAELLLHRKRNTLLGKNVWEEFPQAPNSNLTIEFNQAMDTGESRQLIEFYPPLNTWFDINIYSVPEGLAIHFRDISDKKAADERMRLLESSIERLNDLVVITDASSIDAPDGPKIVYVNDAFVNLTGYAKEEIIGQTPRILQGPETDKIALNKIRQALENKRTVRVELLNYSRTGDKYWLEVDIAPIFSADGTHTHWVAVQRDITERKGTDNALKLSDERFQLLSRATNDVIWDWDFHSNQIWWNNSMESVFGHDRDQLESGPESWTNRIYPDDLERVMLSIHKAINGDEQSWSDEYRFIKADGGVAMVLDRGFIIRDEAGTALRMLGSMVDLSEQRNLEIQLREAQKLEAVGQLTGGIAHDFNNLLTVIIGNLEELQDRLGAELELTKLTELAVSAAERGAELTNGLLAFSRRQALNPKVLNITRPLQTMEALFKRTLPEHIDLDVVSAANTWTIHIDPGQLEVALLNLVLNARDAMPEGGKLTIETANAFLDEDYVEHNGGRIELREYLMVSVSDTGAGMDADIQTRAIEPFFTTKEFGRGSGLGLSMVYGFTKQSNGHLKIYSELGKGTAVKLYFPRTQLAANKDPAPVGAMSITGGTEHILVVEDDELVRDYVTGQLAALGYRVSQADSGPQALEALARIAPVHLLLTDIVMPGGMTGRQLAETVVARHPEVRVLYTSGYTENTIVHHGRLDAGVQLLGKPYSRRDLAIKVRSILDE